jgi:hypothetical protein
MTMDIILVRHATCARMDEVLPGRTVDPPLGVRGDTLQLAKVNERVAA